MADDDDVPSRGDRLDYGAGLGPQPADSVSLGRSTATASCPRSAARHDQMPVPRASSPSGGGHRPSSRCPPAARLPT